MLVLSTLVGGCGGGQGGARGQDEQSTQKPVVGEYVGTASDKDAFVAMGSLKASSNDFVADERLLEGPADLTIYNGIQIAFYAHLGQACLTFHNSSGSLDPATPFPRISVSILG
jgi:hypothetical protein